MKWGDISKVVHQAENDLGSAAELGPSYRWGEEKADAEELDQWTIDEIFNLLGTAIINAKAAMEKLRPHTTYHKKENT